MMRSLAGSADGRSLALLIGLFVVLLVVPLVADDYVVTVAILILYFAYVGQAWNILTGFTGYLSLGHALYVGLGAYTAAVLFERYGIAPWFGMLAAIPVAMLVGAFMGYLAFRFGVSGVYFAILTIAFASFARVGFDHWSWVGASAGLFLPVGGYSGVDLWHLRGPPRMFYYVILGLTVAGFAFCAALLRSRIGYCWQAIREDEAAARALGIDVFRYKMAAVTISAGMTSLAGVFFAFYYNNLFPEQIFSIGRSIDLILAPFIGGVGTLFGPILGAVLLQVLSEGMNNLLMAFGFDIPGAQQIFFGICLLFVIVALPEGVWPWLARRIGLAKGPS